MRIFILLIMFVISSCGDLLDYFGEKDAGQDKIFYTESGVPFIKIQTTLGESYKAPDGLIWTDVAKNPSKSRRDFGSVGYLNAKKYCKEAGYRLPTKKEYLRLVGFMSADPNNAKTYKPQILPNLENVNLYFDTKTNTRIFVSAIGIRYFNDHCVSNCFARCVK